MSCRFLLDTNMISEINKPIPNPLVVERFDQYQSELGTAATVVHELLYGTLRLQPESSRRRYLGLWTRVCKLMIKDANRSGNATQNCRSF